MIILISFPPFSISSQSFFLLFKSQSRISSIASSFIKIIIFLSSSRFSYSLVFSFFFYLFVLSYSIPSVICLRKLFSFIHLKYRPVVVSCFFFLRFTFTILRFLFFKVISFFLYFILLKHASILRKRFGQKMHDKRTKRNVDAYEPSLC